MMGDSAGENDKDPMDGHPPTVEWSTTIPGMVVTFLRTVTHHFLDGQLDLEFDSNAAQLVLICFQK